MNKDRKVTYAELDRPKCTRTYGVAPCTAEVGTTGDFKCYNSPATCQDVGNYEAEVSIVRWVTSSEYASKDIQAFPSIKDIDVDPQRLDPGESLGKREQGKIEFYNHPDNDSLFDPYLDSRDFNPFNKGTFAGKFLARYPNIEGYEFRIYDGHEGQTLDEMECRHYIADKFEIDTEGEIYSFTFKDVLNFVEFKKTLYPHPSSGVLDVELSVGGDTITLSPEGVGDALNPDGTLMYPLSGHASIGDEYIKYTKIADSDVLNITDRGFKGTPEDDHEAGETVQVMAVFEAKRPSEILEILFSSTEIPSEYIDVELWEDNIDAFNSRNYNGIVAGPTEIHKLVGELMRDIGMNMYTDIVNRKIFGEQIRQRIPVFNLDDNILKDPVPKIYYSKRISGSYVLYGRYSPLEKMDEDKNYRARLFRFNDNQKEVLQQNTPSINTHYSRWLLSTQRSAADDLAFLKIGRYGTAPRGLTAKIKTEFAPQLGTIGNVSTRVFEDSQGDFAQIPMQIIQLNKMPGESVIVFEEFRANFIEPDPGGVGDPTVRIIDFQVDLQNLGEFDDLRQIYDYNFADLPEGTTVRFIADPGIIFGGDGLDSYSVYLGDWPEVDAGNAFIKIENLTILGRGGGYSSGNVEELSGGNALFLRHQVDLVNCFIGAGGGMGGTLVYMYPNGGFTREIGGGGAGRAHGVGYNPGTDFEGGDGIDLGDLYSGDGGNLGEWGADASHTYEGGTGLGYPPGVAIDGFSYVNLDENCVIAGETKN